MARDVRVLGLVGSGHLLSHFHHLAPPVLLGWAIDIGADHWVFWLIGICAAVSLRTIVMPKGSRVRAA